MRKVLLSIGLAALMCGTSGCFSMCGSVASGWGDGTSGGRSTMMDEVLPVSLDIITLPVQAAAVVIIGTGWLLWEGGELVVEGTEKLFE